ncbi:PH domain-containing protein [Microbacterium binotii]|jgi:membrane protein YdbS with pleckstrin-like domain|uniref:YdbS-like PH domain-containing protein n=1 Tax=Microbacterium binotii TaxID=462710 RepID=A0ABN3P9M9_9MICO
MTNPTPGAPEATPSPTSDEAVLDAGTFEELLESRREGLFVRDGSWHQLARAYRTVQLISLTAAFVLVAVAAPVIAAVTGTGWVWIPAGVLLVVLAITLILTPRQIRSFGYRLRENDLVLRRGILFQRVVAVPYGRMQLVDITHGPLDRAFGIAQLKLVTAAAASAVVIPGLTQDAAEKLRDVLIAVAESRRTGL